MKGQEDEITKGSLVAIEKMIGRDKLDLPLSLGFAAARGDEALMHKLLKNRS